jgi:hypothetical protein
MTTKNNPIKLADFAFKKQGPLDAGVTALLNIVITWFLLGGVTSIPVISPPGSEFSKSLLGTLVPPAVIIAGLLAYVEAVTAVLRTPDARSPVALPLTSAAGG